MDWLRAVERPPLPGEDTPEGAQRIRAKLRVLENSRPSNGAIFTEKHLFILKSDGSGNLSIDDAILWMRVWLLSDNDLYFCLEAWRGKGPGCGVKEDWLNQNVSVHNERKSISLLRQQLKDRLNFIRERLSQRSQQPFVGICRVYSLDQGKNGEKPATGDHASLETESLTKLQSWEKGLRLAWDTASVRMEQLYSRYGSTDLAIFEPHSKLSNSNQNAKDFLASVASSLGVSLNGVEAAYVRSFGKALVASRNLDRDECVMEISESNLLSIYTVLLSGFSEPVPFSVKQPDFAYSTAFVAAFLLNGRFCSDGDAAPFPQKWMTEHPRLQELYSLQPVEEPLIEEQLFLVWSLLVEARRGAASPFHRWLQSLEGYNGDVRPASQNLLLAPSGVAQFVDNWEISESLEEVHSCLPRFHKWLRDLLPPLFPHLFDVKEFDDGWFSLKRIYWACWVSESREFESVLLPPLAFVQHLPWDSFSTDSSYWGGALTRTFTDLRTGSVSFHGEDRAPPELPILPGMQLLRESGGKSRKVACLPIVIGWDSQGLPTVEMMQFHVPRSVSFLLPVIDYINHHPAAQCLHPGLSLADRLTLHSESPTDLTTVEGLRDSIQSIPPRKIRLTIEGRVPKGSQLFISYGPHENWSLLRFYGFCPQPINDLAADCYRPDVFHMTFEPEGDHAEHRLNCLRKLRMPLQHLLNRKSVATATTLDYCSMELFVRFFQILHRDDVNESECVVADEAIMGAAFESVSDSAKFILQELLETQQVKWQRLKEWQQSVAEGTSKHQTDAPEWVAEWGERVGNLLKRNIAMFESNLEMLEVVLVAKKIPK